MENRLEKRCRICGDKALSFNFNGLCCESCKIFFRRNAFNLQNLKCYLNNNCPITKDTRTKCKLCRLNKCFDIGMKKELIVFRINNEHKSDKQRVNKNVELSNILKPSTQSCQKSTDLIAVRNVSNSKCDNILTQNTETPELLTYYECHCLELIKKVTISFNEEPPVGVPILGYSTSLINVFNSQLAHLPLMLSFANSIAPFRTLPQNQQLPIFKTAFPQILLLRSAYYFNFDKNAFLVRSVNNQSGDAAFYVKLDTIYPGENSHEAIDLHRKVAFMVRCEMEGDTFLRDLMSILLLFNSKSQIDNPEYIRYQYFSYCHILRKYLSNKYSTNPRKASQKYLKLMEIIENIEMMTEHAQKHWIAHAVATDQISDVLAEIYSLKNC